MFFNKYKLGLRAIKTTIAVAFCIILAIIFKREDKFYASIAAIICMCKTNSETLAAGLRRIVGTVIGGAVGLAVLLVTRLSPNEEMINLFLCPFCVVLIIYICNVAGRKSSVEIGTIVALGLLMSRPEPYSNTFMYVANRVLDTSMGILVAMFVNKFLFKARTLKDRRYDAKLEENKNCS